jgi:hypothetical protein
MELVNPDGSKMAVPETNGKEQAPEQKAEEPKKAPFICEINAQGIMRIEANLPVCVNNDGLLYMLRGFLDAKRDEAISSVLTARAELAKQKAVITQAANKGMFRNFLRRK